MCSQKLPLHVSCVPKITPHVWWHSSAGNASIRPNQKISDSTHRDASKAVPNASLAPFPAELRAFEVCPFSPKIGALGPKITFSGFWRPTWSKKSCFRPKIVKNRSVTFLSGSWPNFPGGRNFPLLGGSRLLFFRVWGRKRDFSNFENTSHVPISKKCGGVEIRVNFSEIEKFRKFPKF